MAEQETVRVNVTNVATAGKTFKIKGQDDWGNEREYTMMTHDKDSGQPNTPPEFGELYLFVYGQSTGEYQGKTQTTYWVNEIRMAQPRNGNVPAAQPAQQAAPQPPQQNQPAEKDAYDVRQDATRVSIEKQQALKYAVAFYATSSVNPRDVVTVAWQFYDEFLAACASPAEMEAAHEDAMAQHDGWPTDGQGNPPVYDANGNLVGAQ